MKLLLSWSPDANLEKNQWKILFLSILLRIATENISE